LRQHDHELDRLELRGVVDRPRPRVQRLGSRPAHLQAVPRDGLHVVAADVDERDVVAGEREVAAEGRAHRARAEDGDARRQASTGAPLASMIRMAPCGQPWAIWSRRSFEIGPADAWYSAWPRSFSTK